MIKKFNPKTEIRYLILFLSLFFSDLIFPQFTSIDKELVKITFERTFDKNIINEYLESNQETKINAALLSISHGEDTSFVNDIIKLDFTKYEEYICFALGQIGKCNQSLIYLLDKLDDTPSDFLLEAIGKVADEKSAETVLERLKNIPDYSITIFHLYNNGSIAKEKAQNIIIEQIKNNPTENNTFALFRIGPPENSKELFVQALKNLSIESNEVEANLLGCMRKLKYFPDDLNFFFYSLENNNKSIFYISIEYIKTLCYFPFKSEKELASYLEFLSDGNPNISRQTAISLAEIKINEDLKSFLKNKINTMILSDNLTDNAKGELFLT
ncbi:MAG TPA: hypothetical protein VLN45_04515, partial [Ignavibacteriaceae bacterium]|nr:hypothetical protein [Ignavibacteriaceae bacterium]